MKAAHSGRCRFRMAFGSPTVTPMLKTCCVTSIAAGMVPSGFGAGWISIRMRPFMPEPTGMIESFDARKGSRAELFLFVLKSELLALKPPEVPADGCDETI